jgi:hypothetical protein
MIVTSNGCRALLLGLFIAAVSRTGCQAVRRRGKSQRRAAKAFTVTHFQLLALDTR